MSSPTTNFLWIDTYHQTMNEDVLFIHVPKTAGRSILTACGVQSVDHLSLRQYIEMYGKEKVLSMFKFTVVRNPWDRLFSVWRFFVRDKPEFEKYKNNFELWLWDKKQAFLSRHPTEEISVTNQQLNHMEWYKDINGFVHIDCYLRYEHLAEDFKLVRDRIGVILPNHEPLPTIGMDDFEKSGLPSKDYHDYYKHDEIIGFVGELNRELIDRFGYQF